jgi:hypothetical protein
MSLIVRATGPLTLVLAVLLIMHASPVQASDEDPDLPDTSSAPESTMGGVPDVNKLQGQLGGLESQLTTQEHTDRDPSLPHLLRVVQAIKNGGQGVTPEDLGLLRGYLRKMGEDSSNPELGQALDMMGQQLETLQHQRAHPEDDPLKELGLDQ